MYGRHVRRTVLELVEEGLSASAVARRTGVARSTVRTWVSDPAAALRERPSCFACAPSPCPCPGAYAYLLGQYLGDGYLVTTARVPKLRIICADDYPGIAAEVDAAMEVVSGNTPGSVQSVGCTDRYSYWMHWPCLLPQHGPGLKHRRPIVLADWQQTIVDDHPWPFIRGLIHSDGCRSVNRVVAPSGKQ